MVTPPVPVIPAYQHKTPFYQPRVMGWIDRHNKNDSRNQSDTESSAAPTSIRCVMASTQTRINHRQAGGAAYHKACRTLRDRVREAQHKQSIQPVKAARTA
ncbi:hypothetical protein GCM10010971_14660 [Silvimonas amylolytica]|uniref:Uncharacterized protein n=1 Tax=Silvimonas amylolytica TaxID=449663 RepID=A0ABQ2PJ68_9NEIS|nr:hypothetical protein GCM10010971_14660 [Silvimonas amylolytica]